MRITQTNEVGDLINVINNIQIWGEADVLTAVKVAQLSLKHRKNKSQRQRVIVFVGHPIQGTEEDFEDVGMRLKKNNVAIDVINFSNPDNVSRLQTLVATANAGGDDTPNCHFLDVPVGVTHITDVMITSPILQPEDAGMGGPGDVGMGGAGAGGDPMANLGFDPNMDPELAMALRLSMEEANAAEAQNNPPAQEVPATNANPNVQPGLAPVNEDDNMYDEDPVDDEEELQKALALSMVPDANGEVKPQANQPERLDTEANVPQTAEEKVDIDANFMKDVIGELGIDID